MAAPVLCAGSKLALADSAPTRADWHQSWLAYRDTFIDGQGRVIDYSQDEGISTSEGQAYGMFFCLAAGERDLFHRILNWTNVNLAGNRLGEVLPVWKWGFGAGNWGPMSGNSASDADAWIAYVLLMAGRRWNDAALFQLGGALATRIIEQETAVLPAGRVLIPGPQFFPRSAPVLFNPSYCPQFLLAGVAALTGNPDWLELARNLPDLLAIVAQNGFAPDWAWYPGPPEAPANDLPQAGIGSYDAIRVYLWAGITAPETPGAAAILRTLSGMAAYLAAHTDPPLRVAVATGTATGAGPVGFSGALLPYLARLGAQPALRNQLRRLAECRQPNGAHSVPPLYYPESLILFGTGAYAGVFRFDAAGMVRFS